MSNTLGLGFFVEVVLTDFDVNLIRLRLVLTVLLLVIGGLAVEVVVERRVVVVLVTGPAEEPGVWVTAVGSSGTDGLSP